MFRVFFTIGAVQLLAMGVLAARAKGLALVLGPELVGILAVIDKLTAVFAQTAALSLPFAAIRFLPALWETDRRTFHVRLRAMSVTLLGLTAAATAIALLIMMAAPGLLGAELLGYRAPLLVALLTIPLVALVSFVQNAVAAGFAPRKSMVFYLTHAAAFAASGVVGAWWAGLIGVYATYAVVGGLLMAWMLVRLNIPADPSLRMEMTQKTLRLPREIWRFGLFLLGLAFLSPYAALFVHYRVLSDLGPAAAGWMQAAAGISLAVRGVLGAAHPVFLTPNVNRGGAPADRVEWAAGFQKTFCLLTGISLPPLLLFPTFAVRVLYSDEFLPGAGFVFLFVLVEIVTLMAGTYQALVLAYDRLGFHVGQNVAAQALVIVIGAVSIPSLGIAGAALASLVAQVFLYVSTMTFLSRTYRVRIPRETALLMVYLVGVLVTSGIMGLTDISGTWRTVAVRGALYVVLASGFALFLSREDQMRVRGVLWRIRKHVRPRPAP